MEGTTVSKPIVAPVSTDTLDSGTILAVVLDLKVRNFLHSFHPRLHPISSTYIQFSACIVYYNIDDTDLFGQVSMGNINTAIIAFFIFNINVNVYLTIIVNSNGRLTTNLTADPSNDSMPEISLTPSLQFVSTVATPEIITKVLILSNLFLLV